LSLRRHLAPAIQVGLQLLTLLHRHRQRLLAVGELASQLCDLLVERRLALLGRFEQPDLLGGACFHQSQPVIHPIEGEIHFVCSLVPRWRPSRNSLRL
jgi:hypothetical protein